MLWANLMQTEIVPPFLAQAGTAVVIIYLSLQIVKVAMQFAGRGPGNGKEDHNGHTEWRLQNLDKRVDECVTRPEYETSRRDMREQLNRIESKLDNMWGSRRVFTGEKQQ